MIAAASRIGSGLPRSDTRTRDSLQDLPDPTDPAPAPARAAAAARAFAAGNGYLTGQIVDRSA